MSDLMDPQTLDPRRAMEITRYHTWPRLRHQSIGEHGAQIWRLLKVLWPDCHPRLLDHAMTHDIGEAVSGDPPYPVKRINPELKTKFDAIELAAHLGMVTAWDFPEPVELDDFEKQVFKLAEYIDMWEYGLSELTLGNRASILISERMMDEIVKSISNITVDPFSSNLGYVIAGRAVSYIARRHSYYQLVTKEKAPTDG